MSNFQVILQILFSLLTGVEPNLVKSQGLWRRPILHKRNCLCPNKTKTVWWLRPVDNCQLAGWSLHRCQCRRENQSAILHQEQVNWKDLVLRSIWHQVCKKTPITMDHFNEFFKLLPQRADSECSWTVTVRRSKHAAMISKRSIRIPGPIKTWWIARCDRSEREGGRRGVGDIEKVVFSRKLGWPKQNYHINTEVAVKSGPVSLLLTFLFDCPINVGKLIFLSQGTIHWRLWDQTNGTILFHQNFQQISLFQFCLPASESREGDLPIAADL